MKIRQGFVTNSSSTSYIIAKKKEATWKPIMWPAEAQYIESHATIAGELATLRDLLFEMYGDDCTVHGDSILDLCIDHYRGRDIWNQFGELLELINNGYEIFHFSIDRDYEYEADFSFDTDGDTIKLIEKESQ